MQHMCVNHGRDSLKPLWGGFTWSLVLCFLQSGELGVPQPINVGGLSSPPHFSKVAIQVSALPLTPSETLGRSLRPGSAEFSKVN